MSRYFIEVAYVGTNYSGFQIQENANSIQGELENALSIFLRKPVELTGSSRTDAGVHALSNFFHFDEQTHLTSAQLYNINSILPNDIVAVSIHQVTDTAHCRFDAISREYKYYITRNRNPFLFNQAWHYPYTVDINLLNQAASLLLQFNDFESFSKKKTQVKNFQCQIQISEWVYDTEKQCLVYHVVANRFLRGMVKGLVSTMLQVGREKINVEQFSEIIQKRNSAYADFSAPSDGLFLCKVSFKDGLLTK
jgi:tRNA pseudouridine38-40 synthase